MVLIDALYINKGGGAVLLDYLVHTILGHPAGDQFFFLLDPRYVKPGELITNYAVVPNSLSERKAFYKQHRHEYSSVLCFANVPPPVRLKARVYTYMHNQKLLEAPKQKFTRMFWRQYLKYLVIKRYNCNTDHYIVQTPHMVAELTGTGLKGHAHCMMIPFYDNSKYSGGGRPFEQRAADEFVFISNPSPQKNYPTLLDAWALLLQQGHTPKLHVTIDDTAPGLIARVNELNALGARIQNHVYADPRELYFSCRYLIFPSIMESFGLPLIEAADSGMKVLAANLPYVYDVITPTLTFEPYDKAGMAAAVLKAMADATLSFPEVVTRNEVEKLVALLKG